MWHAGAVEVVIEPVQARVEGLQGHVAVERGLVPAQRLGGVLGVAHGCLHGGHVVHHVVQAGIACSAANGHAARQSPRGVLRQCVDVVGDGVGPLLRLHGVAALQVVCATNILLDGRGSSSKSQSGGAAVHHGVHDVAQRCGYDDLHAVVLAQRSASEGRHLPHGLRGHAHHAPVVTVLESVFTSRRGGVGDGNLQSVGQGYGVNGRAGTVLGVGEKGGRQHDVAGLP
mmetsp:Transcript_9435/g.18844  ORF Transcript_9435/g.18844 Transcript_9435/m.18844 type:complete len:228 (+) Transcript_9435:285-968(+)